MSAPLKRSDSEKKREKERKAKEKSEKFAAKKDKQKNAVMIETAPKQDKSSKVTKTSDAYTPKKIEEGRYQWWEDQGFFKPQFTPEGKIKPAGSFVIPIPPPNVTGSLHMGHGLTNALQDTMIRHARMCGKTTAWIPGCDHAGISTQSVVEKMIWKTEKKTRHDLGREELTKRIWAWKEKYHQNITTQLKSLGGSMDWSREAFTLDENLSRAVRRTFIQLFEEGIIYRSDRLVNWCTSLSTSLSNAEVDNLELEGMTKLEVPGYDKLIKFGFLMYFKYPIKDSTERIEVATTRPETMLGDTGIAVHPDDPRYQHLIGKQAQHPFIPDRKLLIFGDKSVERDFGTGAVKITPSHDHNDFKRGKEHNLEFVTIFSDNGKLNENAGSFAGMRRFDARYEVEKQLKEKGLWVKEEENKGMIIPRCSKSKDIIEPLIKPQWWMKMESLIGPAVEAVKSGQIKIKPEKDEKDFFRWMGRMDDWCLSRQLWWGHRAPAYFVDIEGEAGNDADGNLWVCAESEEEARVKAEKKFPGKKFTLRWDEDVLDTWFSSGLWPFSTLGWPEKTHDLETLYPTSMLETGWDILFFWVIRMILLGIKMTGQIPFSEVYCHGLIRDGEGRKMSKTLGNVIDPLDVIQGISLQALHDKLQGGNLEQKEIKRAEGYQKKAFPKGIPECGTDALRFTLISYTTGLPDINFQIEKLEAERRFCNKIYQATNFVLKRLGDDFKPTASEGDSKPTTLAEKWILNRYNAAATKLNADMEAREFYELAQTLRRYWRDELCDVFIEATKGIFEGTSDVEQESTKQTLYTAMEGALRLLHPVMPFITEYLWQKLPRRKGDPASIMIASYPQGGAAVYEEEAAEFDKITRLADEARSFLTTITDKKGGRLYVKPNRMELGQEQFLCFNSLIASSKAGSAELLSGSEPKGMKLLEQKEAEGLATLFFFSGGKDADGHTE